MKGELLGGLRKSGVNLNGSYVDWPNASISASARSGKLGIQMEIPGKTFISNSVKYSL
jgi:hypothetical protein